MIDYKKDIDWENAQVTPLGRFYKALKLMDISDDDTYKIVNALTESGVYSYEVSKNLVAA